MSNYLDYMMNFQQSDLRAYIGEDIIELLVEWLQKEDTLLTKKRMISIIDSIYGVSILKDNSFRRNLLLCMNADDIFKIRDNCLSGSEKCVTSPDKLVDIISSKPWKKNTVSIYLSQMWGVSETIFDKETEINVVKKVISSSQDQFYELLDYQYYIKQRTLYNLNSGNLQERMLIHMPTGTGKTKTSMHIINNYIQFSLQNKGAVIWIAHTTELLDQAYNTFVNVWEHLGNGEINVYKIWGTNSFEDASTEINGIVFCGLSKLMSIADSNPALYIRLKKDCRLIVFDEAHKAAADKTKSIIEDMLRIPSGFENRALLGLSATPGRTTELSYNNNLLSNMFGGKLIYIDPDTLNRINMGQLGAINSESEPNIIKYFQNRHILSKMYVERLTYNHDFSQNDLSILSSALRDLGYDEKEYTDKQLQVLASNKMRNMAILKKLRMLYNENKPTIVFACSVNHAKMLSTILTLENIPNSLVLGEMDPIDRKKSIDIFKDRNSNVNIIINYEVLTTGFDSKNIQCVFITRPTKSIVLYSQMLGRGLRGPLMGGNENCLLVDIEDNLVAFDNETAFSHFDNYWRI